VVKVGDEVMVMVTEIDRLGRINLSRRAVFQKLSQVSGAHVGTGQKESSDYPFKRHTESRSPNRDRDENGRLSGYVYVDIDTSKRDIGSYVADAKKAIRANVQLPPGYMLIWSGQFEYMEAAKARLIIVIPITIFLVFLLLLF
jgi:multidrug efflux pump subunit AcrB